MDCYNVKVHVMYCSVLLSLIHHSSQASNHSALPYYYYIGGRSWLEPEPYVLSPDVSHPGTDTYLCFLTVVLGDLQVFNQCQPDPEVKLGVGQRMC